MKHLSFFLVVISFSLFVFSCNSNEEEKNEQNAKTDSLSTAKLSEIIPSFEDFDVAYTRHEMDTKSEFNFKTESGSEVSVPSGAFIDAEGNPIDGKVDIQYREIKSPSEMIISGVDMKYEKDGKVYDFQTAGMFDLRAYSNGEEVYLKEDKQIDVTFASNVPGDYGFYFYSENDGNWVETDFGKIEVVEEDTQEELNIKNTSHSFLPVKPIKLNPAEDLVLEVKVDYSKYPEIKDYKGIIWKYNGTQSNEEVKALVGKIWSSTDIEKDDNNNYVLVLTSGKKSYKLDVAPVFSPRNYKKAMEKYEAQQARQRLLANANIQIQKRLSAKHPFLSWVYTIMIFFITKATE